MHDIFILGCMYPDNRRNAGRVSDYLKQIGVPTIGHFGEWDYLWSYQAFLSGCNCVLLEKEG